MPGKSHRTPGLRDLKSDIRDSWSTCFEEDADIESGFLMWEADVISRWVHASDFTNRDELMFVLQAECSTRAPAS